MRENELLEVKGSFSHAPGPKPGAPSLPVGGYVESSHFLELANQLQEVKRFWQRKKLGIDPLVGAFYTRIVAKSNRISRLFSYSVGSPNDCIVGAKFYDSAEDPKHQITYSVPEKDIDRSIEELELCARVVGRLDGRQIDKATLDGIMKNKLEVDLLGLRKTNFGKLVRDAFYLDKFGITEFDENIEGNAIISLFKVAGSTRDGLLKKFNIEVTPSAILDDAILLQEHEFRKLADSAPFLIAMGVTDDISCWDPDDYAIDKRLRVQPTSIDPPRGEPVVGVIDTGFFKEVYFADDWVEYDEGWLDGSVVLSDKDREHGTAVTSIIVDGPRLNPDLDDGCGSFRVEHFCVAPARHFSSFAVMKKILQIVESNPGIKVWNLSLGSELAVRANSISPEAAILDRLQYEKNIIFVVAGTNNSLRLDNMPIGAPADSLNSLVVNSVDRGGEPSSYSRKGPVLSFYAKPDVSYFGGTPRDQITVAAPFAASSSYGTSIAAPWITRKVAYLVGVMQLDVQLAKALIIHSATSWEKIEQSSLKGYGVVPQRIEDILYVGRDEIRFVLSQEIRDYKTYSYRLPVPSKDGMYPFKARATLCYSPLCSRNQGVDYTNSEVSLSFGRIGEKKKETTDSNGKKVIEEYQAIFPINNDSQDFEGVLTDEKTAREHYRKWDNVKHVGEILKKRNPGCKKYKSSNWGIAFTVKERLEERSGQGLRVGLVVTLKEVNGVNRINEFRHNLEMAGWIVNSIDMHARAEVIERASVEDLEFD